MMEPVSHAGMPAEEAPSRSRRYDPDRRARILDAALEVIARVGVAGASHRKIAAEADVPLGSMTYYFDGMDQLLEEAFRSFADTIADRFETRMAAATTTEDAKQAVVDIIHEELLGSQRELVLTTELYTLAAREPAFRTLTRDWMARSRGALSRFFEASTTRMLDALIEGLFIHAALDITPPDQACTVEAIRRITTE
jgi:TetR/AcrR family transcriptional regulator, regulator of biofilm formation and stress response